MAPPLATSLLECWEQRDLQRFRVVLKGGHLSISSNSQNAPAGAGGTGLSGSLSSSAGGAAGSYAHSPPSGHGAFWSRSDSLIPPASPAEVNRRDDFGRTALHLACASTEGIAIDFVHALLSHPGLNVNLQDFESGYTALHRALYAGNLPIVLVLLRKADTDFRIKDLEGLTPFDLYNSTISGTNPKWTPEVGGSELYTWGVNRNFTLGLGDGDDRTLPKSVALNKIYDEYALANLDPGGRFDRLRIKDVAMSKLHTVVVTTERSANVWICGFGGYTRLGRANQSQTSLEPLKDFTDCAASVAVAQDHTVIVTTNGDVYTFGQNKFSQVGYVLEKGQGIVGSTSAGSGRGGGAPTATFGGSGSGPQLGGSLGHGSSSTNGGAGGLSAELDLQVSPRKVSGVLKKEIVKGAAASKIHTAVFTADALYTWGTNTGQLGYDRSATPVQVYPRKVTSITAAQPIKQIAATEFATACLLESEEIIVLHNDGHFRLQLPLAPTTRFPTGKEVFTPRKVQRTVRAAKITSSGTTFAALSHMGDLFTFSLEHPSEYANSGGSNVRPEVSTIWSVRRKFTAVRDVAIGGDGSIILSTESGHVYVRERRTGADKVALGPKVKAPGGASSQKSAFKFQQIPSLQRVVKVATNESGGWAAIKADAPPRDIRVRGRSIEEDLQSLLPHLKVREISRHGFEEEREISVEVTDTHRLAKKREADEDDDSDDDSDGEGHVSNRHLHVARLLGEAVRRWEAADVSQRDAYGPNNLTPPFGCDMFLVADGRYIPAHRMVLAVRIPSLREALSSPTNRTSRALPDGVVIQQASDTVVTLTLPHCGFPTAIFLLHYLYTNDLPAVWTASIGLQIAEQYRSSEIVPATIQAELLALTGPLKLDELLRPCLVSPNPRTAPATLRKDMELLFQTQVAVDVSLSPLHDTELLLADRITPCHSVILRRSPFYADFFRPEWTSTRFKDGRIQINMRHLRWEVARLLLLHLYTDAGVELFKGADEDRTADQFIDFVLEVLAAADEWALAKLKQVCSLLLRRRVLPQNLSAMMTDADTFNAVDLKEACMLQATQTMESLLETGMLDELEGKQLRDLTTFVRKKQDERTHRSLVNDLLLAIIVANQEHYDQIVRDLKAAKTRPRKASVSSLQVPNSPEIRPFKASHDDSLIFDMEEDDVSSAWEGSPSLGAVSRSGLSAVPAWTPLPKSSRTAPSPQQAQPNSSLSRSPPSSVPGSAAKPAMTWASKPQAAEVVPASSGITNLRSIMESERAKRPGPGVVQGGATPTPSQSTSSWRQSGLVSSSAGGSGTATPQPPSPSLLPVNFASAKVSQKDRRRQAMMQNQRQPSTPGPSPLPATALRSTGFSYSAVSGGSPVPVGTPGGSPWKVPSSAGSAAIPSPSPLAARTRDAIASTSAAAASSAASPSNGFPWKSPPPATAVPLAPVGSLPKSQDANTSAEYPQPGSIPRTPSKFSFAQIQEQQQQDLESDLRRASVKKSFAEILEEERRAEQEERTRRAEAAEFERWFENESKRVQAGNNGASSTGSQNNRSGEGG